VVFKAGLRDASLLQQKGIQYHTEKSDSIQSITSEPGPDPNEKLIKRVIQYSRKAEISKTEEPNTLQVRDYYRNPAC
jgi:hypothetical protein